MGMRVRKWLVLGVACFLIFLADYMQFQLSSYAYLIIPELGLNASQFSSLLMAPMLTAVFTSVPLGSLADRYGSKRVILAAGMLAIAGAGMRIGATDFATYFAAMVLLGFSPASLNANLIKIFGFWFDDRINIAMGAFYASASCGIVAALLTSHLFSSVTAAYSVTATALVVGMVLWAVLARSEAPKSARASLSTVRYMAVAARNRSVWIVAVVLGLGLASTTALSGFFPQFLEFDWGIGADRAGFITAQFTLGSIVGSLVGPAICYQIGHYKPLLLPVGFIGGALMTSVGTLPVMGLGASMLLMGIFTSAAGPVLEALPYSFSSIGEKYAGSAGGIIGMVSMGMAFVVPTAISAICPDSYPVMFELMGLAFIASTVCLFRLPDIGEA